MADCLFASDAAMVPLLACIGPEHWFCRTGAGPRLDVISADRHGVQSVIPAIVLGKGISENW